jgi:mannose-6-phosphate isomerase-like protein (cupin superfamily)
VFLNLVDSTKAVYGTDSLSEEIAMKFESINLKKKLAKFSDHWSPKVIGQMNDYQFKLVKIQGHFTWHDHKDTDEVFIVLEGEMSIDFRDGRVNLAKGEMFIVPKGREHKPFAEKECQILLIEPKGVVNTGEVKSDLTAENDVWI